MRNVREDRDWLMARLQTLPDLHRMVLEVGEVDKVDESTHVLMVLKKGGIAMGELRERVCGLHLSMGRE
jgi:hypothetical protein